MVAPKQELSIHVNVIWNYWDINEKAMKDMGRAEQIPHIQ